MLTKFKSASSRKKKRSIIILLIITALISWQVISLKSFNRAQITKYPSDNKVSASAIEQENSPFPINALIQKQSHGKLTSQKKYPTAKTKDNIKKSHIDSLGTFDCLENILSIGDEQVDDYQQSVDDFLKSGDPLYYALFGPTNEKESRFDLLYDYNKYSPNNPLVSNDLISNCSEGNIKCTPEFIEQLIQADANNGASWLSVVSFYVRKKDDTKVLASIKAMENTAYYNERFGERALLYVQAVEGSTSNNFTVNAAAGIGIGANSLTPLSPILTWCRANINIPVRAQACLILGEQLETRSQTAISYAYGLAIQSSIYTETNNTEFTKIIGSKRRLQTESLHSETFQNVALMMLLDERLMRSYLKGIDTEGEVGSQKLLIEEAEILYHENDNYLCTLINEAISSLL